MVANEIYLVICEGDSEVAYVQELNRFLNERGARIVFQAVNSGGGGFSTVRQCCRDRKTRRNGRTFVFADRDIYVRNDSRNSECYEREKEVLPPFLFQTWNFEDFLLLHFPSSVVSEWRRVAMANGHLNNPMHASEYLPIYIDFCRKNAKALCFDLPYEKGDMPFPLTDRHIANLRANIDLDFPRSEFAALILKVLEKSEFEL